MLEKMKNYYRNSPKRFGWSWVGLHVIILLIGLVCIYGKNIVGIFTPGAIVFVPIMIWLFPISPLLNLPPEVLGDNRLILSCVHLAFFIYYGLFFVLVYYAKNMQSKIFLRLLLAFSVLFFINVVCSFYILFHF